MADKSIPSKNVLIINASPLFREFLKEKLSMENVGVEVASGKRDAFTKLINILPSLVIIDVENTFSDLMEFLQSKYKDPNAKKIPIIIAGPVLERNKISALVQFGVVKYFTKPIKFDIFFEAIGKILRANFSMDTTPCVLEIHHNDNIIFIEIAQGLNREKIALLKYKLTEMIDTYNIQQPKVVVMMSNIELSFVDGINVELLLDTITSESRIQRKNIKILSFDNFIAELIDGHPSYYGIKVIHNLAEALHSLVDNHNIDADVTEVISNTFLNVEERDQEGSVEMRFLSDNNAGSAEISDENNGNILNIAVVDDDEVIRKILAESFTSIGAQTDVYESGARFMGSLQSKNYDLVILDIFMAGLSGFDILNQLRSRPKPIPTIIYSQAIQREYVIQALTLGAKSYLVKPQKPEVILQKAMEVLHEKL